MPARSAVLQSPRRPAAPVAAALQLRAVRPADLPEVIRLDATVTGLHKADQWQRVYRRYGVHGQGLRHFMVAQAGRPRGGLRHRRSA